MHITKMPDADHGLHPRKQLFYKFLLLCAVLVSYFAYLSLKYDLMTGGIAAALTWSFFVLCTPIADAGFLLDFPMRLLFGVRMLIAEIVVWGLAISVNVVSLIFYAEYYDTTTITKLLFAILTTPNPYWAVIFLSGVGTFLSVRFADELIDAIHPGDREFFHRHGYKHEMLLIIFFIMVFIGYYRLMASLGINVDL